MIITSLSETKDFDKIKTVKGGRDNMRKTHKHMPKMPCEPELQILWFQAICPEDAQPMERSAWSVGRSTTSERSAEVEESRTVHDLEQEPDQHHEEVDHIDTVNINSVYFNNKHSVITANLKTL